MTIASRSAACAEVFQGKLQYTPASVSLTKSYVHSFQQKSCKTKAHFSSSSSSPRRGNLTVVIATQTIRINAIHYRFHAEVCKKAHQSTQQKISTKFGQCCGNMKPP
uniref:Uncharacterized protein n=1 Tax=Opuntia streptacantha TaxID=393608 RepID=A0A7C9EIL5_OPUST